MIKIKKQLFTSGESSAGTAAVGTEALKREKSHFSISSVPGNLNWHMLIITNLTLKAGGESSLKSSAPLLGRHKICFQLESELFPLSSPPLPQFRAQGQTPEQNLR